MNDKRLSVDDILKGIVDEDHIDNIADLNVDDILKESEYNLENNIINSNNESKLDFKPNLEKKNISNNYTYDKEIEDILKQADKLYPNLENVSDEYKNYLSSDLFNNDSEIVSKKKEDELTYNNHYKSKIK